MSKFGWAAAIAAAGGAIAFLLVKYHDNAPPAAATAGGGVPVETGIALKKKVPVVLEALGNVTTIASVAIKPRIDDEIVGVHFADGAKVKEGDLLITLDKRALEAQLQQAEAVLARDQAQLEGAERDIRRNSVLTVQGAGPLLNLDNSKTQGDMFRGAIRADNAAIENLRVQLSYCEIRAPISGRTSQAAVKVGNFVHSADVIPIATINQMQPVYVTFTVGQQYFPSIRAAIANHTTSFEVMPMGESHSSHGQLSMVENLVDPASGLATIRATMPNEDEALWPGSIVTLRLTLYEEDAVVVPTSAVQLSSVGTYVYTVENSIAVIKPIEVTRANADEMIVRSGLSGGETLVTNGHLLLSDHVLVSVQNP